MEPTDPRTLALGAGIGVMATLVMSAGMLAAKRLGIMPQSPPEEIVEQGAEAAGARPREDEVDAMATVAHLGFGAAGGAAFAALTAAVRPSVPELVGLPVALAIWATSYFGWIPALRILPPPHRDAPGRAWTMLAVHLVYGSTLGALWRTATSWRGTTR
jgi:hypothetical protein